VYKLSSRGLGFILLVLKNMRGAVPTGLDPISQSTQGLRPGLTYSAPNGAVALPLAASLLFLHGRSQTAIGRFAGDLESQGSHGVLTAN